MPGPEHVVFAGALLASVGIVLVVDALFGRRWRP